VLVAGGGVLVDALVEVGVGVPVTLGVAVLVGVLTANSPSKAPISTVWS
jgi:hypothetical protein